MDSGYHRDRFLNLIRFSGRLLPLPPNDKAGRIKLLKEIEETTEVADKEWLCESIAVVPRRV